MDVDIGIGDGVGVGAGVGIAGAAEFGVFKKGVKVTVPKVKSSLKS